MKKIKALIFSEIYNGKVMEKQQCNSDSVWIQRQLKLNKVAWKVLKYVKNIHTNVNDYVYICMHYMHVYMYM